jgi:hypothetical protein
MASFGNPELYRKPGAMIQKLNADRQLADGGSLNADRGFFADCAWNRLPEGPLFRRAVCEKAQILCL